ncbi:MAG TPA: THUMP domain-containing protein [Anaerolineae bacterium]|nr:THUMP domain-containing protein [Anaerolineae bacterium]
MSPAPIYYAQTMPGFEQIAWLEIRKRFPGATLVEKLFVKDQNGIVVFQCGGEPERLLELRTAEDVFAEVISLPDLSRDWRDLRLIANEIERSSRLERAIRPGARTGRPLTYRVISRRVGNHQYRRMDLEAAVVKGVERKLGKKWTLVEDDADVEIWANILGSRLLCGVRLSDRTMRHRWYRVANLPAALRPSVAGAMVFLTEPSPADVFLDPMCGSGTLIAERLLVGDVAAILGGDIVPRALDASVANVAQLGRPCTFCCWDTCRLPLAAASVDKVAVNLPFGKQIGTRQEIEALYPRFCCELERLLKPGGRAVVLSAEFEMVKQALRVAPALHIDHGYSVAVLGQWARLYLVRRA